MARVSVSTSRDTLSLEGARRATAACERKAVELGVPMNIAIVDSTLHLLSFARYVSKRKKRREGGGESDVCECWETDVV